MIKPVDEIPKSIAEQRESYRKMIRDDINQAIEQGITKFEFEGAYNYKYLAQYAREEANHVLGGVLRKKGKIYDSEGDRIYPRYYDAAFRRHPYIKISSVKGEERKRVFCEIIPENLDIAIEEVVKEREAQIQRRKRKNEDTEGKADEN